MSKKKATPPNAALLEAIAGRVEQGLQVRRKLEPDGRIHIDRQLPFLVVYRPHPKESDPALRSLVAGQPSYLVAPSNPASYAFTQKLVQRIAEIQSEVFGGFLLIEIWINPAVPDATTVVADIGPDFEIAIPRKEENSPTTEAIVAGLREVKILEQSANVLLRPGAPLALSPHRRLLTPAVAKATNTHMIGLATYAAWRSSESGEVYPLIERAMIRQVTRSLAQAAFVFAREETTSRPLHYHSLGRRAVVRAVKQVDKQLASVAESFDLLLAVTPVNSDSEYRRFRRSRNGTPPRFQYRPFTVDPALLKRTLFDIKIERIEDPTLEHLFREKRSELELKLSLIADRLTDRFLPTSVALYGNVSEESVALARTVLGALEGRDRGRRSKLVSGEAFAAAAEIELMTYRSADPSIAPRVELRDDVTSLMVSAGHLLVGRGMAIPKDRVQALIQHEVGTHVVTYWNGRAQPLRLLASGLAHHDELQEGLAVFAEYLVGGLTIGRLRTLAARVLAARAVSDGSEFIDTYRMMVDEVGLTEKSAFTVAMRVHRGGGFVKDAVYLRGLQGVVTYIQSGGRLDSLLVGKIATEHTAVIEELQRRGVLKPPPLRPNFLSDPDTHYRIERVRDGVNLQELVDEV